MSEFLENETYLLIVIKVNWKRLFFSDVHYDFTLKTKLGDTCITNSSEIIVSMNEIMYIDISVESQCTCG